MDPLLQGKIRIKIDDIKLDNTLIDAVDVLVEIIHVVFPCHPIFNDFLFRRSDSIMNDIENLLLDLVGVRSNLLLNMEISEGNQHTKNNGR